MALSRCFSFLLLLAMAFCSPAESGGFIGVNYGRIANNLPNPSKVVELLKSNGISEVKLYDAEPTVLAALSKAGIRVTVALPNELLSAAASHPSFAYSWVKSNVAAWLPSTQIRAVAVGNEVFASSSAKTLTPALLPAMRNIHSALQRLRLDDVVKVSSPVALTVLQSSYPPSTGAFRSDLTETVKGILDFLKSTGSFLMVNAYPFFAYAANADVISIDYALFRPNAGVVDAATGLRYFNLLDAQLDAVYSATKKIGYGDVNVVISETGWPSKGDANEKGATPENAAAYNGNLARRILTGNAGTPLRPDSELGVFLFALFNENQKPGPTSERNYGLFYPNEVKVYDVDFELKGVGTRHDQRGSGDQGTASAGTVSPGSTWCVADGRSGNERLQLALDFACGEGGANCGSIQPGKECFYPNTLLAHASFAFNSYYQKMNRVPNACYFGGAALVVAQPPRFGECVLPAGN